MTGERPVQAGDLVRLTANWGSGCQWKKGIILRVVKRVESFYVCETVHNKKRQTKKILFRFEFEPIACAVDLGATALPDTVSNSPQEAPRDAD